MELTNREFRLQMQLQKVGLLIKEEQLKRNPHFFRLYQIGRDLCSDITEDTIDFHIVDSSSINAIAAYPTKSIVICRGALNAILRIAEAIVESNLFPEMMGRFHPSVPKYENSSLQDVRKNILKPDEDFTLSHNESAWADDFERNNLFNIISELLISFLVCHEIGHHFNKHGDRRRRGEDFSVDVDEMQGPVGSGSLDKQAIESVADDCGFQILVQKFDRRLRLPNPLRIPSVSLLKNKFFQHQGGLMLRCYQIAFIYFWLMETPGWESVDPMEWLYPPAGFRLHTIYASSLENPPLELSRSALFGLLEDALTTSSEIVATAFSIQMDIQWLTQMGSYSTHAAEVLDRMTHWSCEGSGVWEPYSDNSTELAVT